MSQLNNFNCASFFLRIIAAIIDYIFIRMSFYLASLVFNFEANDYFNQTFEIIDLWGGLAVFMYYALTESSRLKGSFGKAIIGLQIIRPYTYQKRLSFLGSIGRQLAKSAYIIFVLVPLIIVNELNDYQLPIWLEIVKLLCILIFLIGCIAPFCSSEQRTLYDMLCGTYVVKR